MEIKDDNLEGLPAVLYAGFWQTQEMGHLKRILNELKIKSLKILIYFFDYKPGALISFDGETGTFSIDTIDSIEGVKYDGAIIGKLGPIIKSFQGHLILKNFANLISGKIKFKGIGSLLKFLKLVSRCAI